MPSTRSKKAKARRSREADMSSDMENMDVMLGSGEYNQIERDIDQMTGFSNLLNRSDDEENHSVRGNSSQENEIRNMPENRGNPNLSRELDVLSGEINLRISQEINSLLNGMNSQIENAINSAISERIIPQMQGVVETVLSRQVGNVQGLSKRPQTTTEDVRNVDENNLHNRYSRSHQNLTGPEDESSYMVTGAFEPQTSVPEFLTGRIHTQPTFSRQASTTNTNHDTILLDPENTTGQPQDPINRLADVLVNLQNKPQNQSLTIRPVNTTTLTFDGKTEKFELFEDLFHTMIKMQPEMSEQMKINHFHSLLRKNALQTFRNINSSNRQTLEDVLIIFRRKYVKPESQATAKHKWHRLTFDPNTMKLPDFLEELNQGAEKAFGENAKSMIDSLLYAKLPPKLKRSVNMARLENGSYEEIVAHLERELELNALEESDDLPIAAMTSSHPTGSGNLLSSGIDPKTNCTYCKEEGHHYKACPKLKAKKEREAKEGKKTKPTYPNCPTCDKTNHPAE